MLAVGTMDAGDGLLATQIAMGCQFRLRAFTHRRVQEWLAQSRGNIGGKLGFVLMRNFGQELL